ncbi:hypothetical protein B5X24_HaOG211795 [Helicoverpa armigera]|uniref:WAP domain-containing protein n=1 Tax=Helicoverpa armigera TaxID=29058 RepID=A0A2W1BH91_HELAM|nr:hypothetical protein B5X24_HaOG211795 [Helicoverpa armigera]
MKLRSHKNCSNTTTVHKFIKKYRKNQTYFYFFQVRSIYARAHGRMGDADHQPLVHHYPAELVMCASESHVHNRGSATILLSVVAVVLMVAYSEAAGDCPLPSKVYGCSPKCVQDYECGNGKVCCSNACNAKSCTVPAGNGQGTGSSGSKYQCKLFYR